FSTRYGDGDHTRFAVGAVDSDDGVHRRIDGIVRVALPAVQANQLIEVPAVVVEADADQRDAEVRGFLAMVAGQDAEAAGIDRERAVQGEFRGEVGNRAVPQLGIATGKPGAVFLREQLEPPHHAIVALQGDRVL